jgi:hypothetical protein
MVRCRGLTTIRIKFVIWDLLKRRFNHVGCMPLTPEELEEQTQGLLSLEQIVEMYH